MPTTEAVVLAAHGVPATDYPRWRVGLLMLLEFAPLVGRIGVLRAAREALDRHMRQWPRTTDNDPYKAAVDELAAGLQARMRWPVSAGYNEFCAPTVAQAIDEALGRGARRVIVLPTMLVRGNEHTESEIRQAVEQARERHSGADIRYAWPFDPDQLLAMLAGQVSEHTGATEP
jgi:sirohydrochlorin cobaltochelatase